MKQMLSPLPLALLLAAPAWGQVEARYGSYTLPDGQVIPEGQNRPPAGHDEIAFRPNCDQVAPVSSSTGTAWVLNMPDGAARTLADYPAGLDAFEARRYLANDGLCAWGGVEVPIIYTAQLPRQQQAQQVSNPTGTVEDGSDRPSANWVGVGIGALVLAGVAGVVAKMATAKPTAAPTDPKAKAADALDDLLEGGCK
ncbi:MAG: hypothetical protein WBG32_08560 [Nodosilinea sp.]